MWLRAPLFLLQKAVCCSSSPCSFSCQKSCLPRLPSYRCCSLLLSVEEAAYFSTVQQNYPGRRALCLVHFRVSPFGWPFGFVRVHAQDPVPRSSRLVCLGGGNRFPESFGDYIRATSCFVSSSPARSFSCQKSCLLGVLSPLSGRCLSARVAPLCRASLAVAVVSSRRVSILSRPTS